MDANAWSFLKVQGTDTHFGAVTEVTYSPSGIVALPMVVESGNYVLSGSCLCLHGSPDRLCDPGNGNHNDRCRRGNRIGVEIRQLPFMLNKQE